MANRLCNTALCGLASLLLLQGCNSESPAERSFWPVELKATVIDDSVRMTISNVGEQPVEISDHQRFVLFPGDRGTEIDVHDQSGKLMPLCAMVDGDEKKYPAVKIEPRSEVYANYRIRTVATLYCLRPGSYKLKFRYRFGGNLRSIESNTVDVSVAPR